MTNPKILPFHGTLIPITLDPDRLYAANGETNSATEIEKSNAKTFIFAVSNRIRSLLYPI